MGCSWPCCATCCSFLSAFGVFFLLILGGLMQQKNRSLDLDVSTMEKHYMAPYICAGVYFAFFVLSCGYLYIHARRKPSAQPSVFPMGPMAEAGGRGRTAAAADTPPALAVEMEESVPRRSGSNAAPDASVSRPEAREEEEQGQEAQGGEVQY